MSNPPPQTLRGQTAKGWCPGALRPMQSGDGLIVRVRPRTGALTLKNARALAEGATRFGNGCIDLTRRANLQLRGITDDSLPPLQDLLRAHHLLDDNAQAESVRNILVSPLAGLDPREPIDVRPFAQAFERHLSRDAALWRLPGKFGFAFEAGGIANLNSERADIRVRAQSSNSGSVVFEIGIDREDGTMWLGKTAEAKQTPDPDTLADIIATLAHAFLDFVSSGSRARMRDLPDSAIDQIKTRAAQLLDPAPTKPTHVDTQPPIGLIPTTTNSPREPYVIGIAAPFGRIDADSLRALTHIANNAGATELRLSPWRILYLAVPTDQNAKKLLSDARRIGFITHHNHPLLKIDACPGAPACRSANSNTRQDARALAEILNEMPNCRSVHVSGCAKGCARSKLADLTLVATPDGYDVILNATTSGTPHTTIPANRLTELPRRVATKPITQNNKPHPQGAPPNA